MSGTPPWTIVDAGHRCLHHLQVVVGIDSQSDESSETVPTTQGQRTLSDHIARTCRAQGAEVSQDECANVFAFVPGRGRGAARPPIALLVHLDTARGTHAVARLRRSPAWDGGPLHYPANPALQVSRANYPDTADFLGQELVHGDGTAPFGLDDKLGLSLCLTLLDRLCAGQIADHPPVLFVGRPDEEVGRNDALAGVVEVMVQRGVTRGYTVDGIQPFEVNIENFNAGHGTVRFPWEGAPAAGNPKIAVRVGGVNTHGATARAEGYRSAVRFAAELGLQGISIVGFCSDEERDCDGVMVVEGAEAEVAGALDAVVGPHRSRGASWDRQVTEAPRVDPAVSRALAFARDLLFDQPGFTIQASSSSGRDGYSNPYRVVPEETGVRVDVRVRDFEESGLLARRAHLEGLAARHGVSLEWDDQYVNMGPRLQAYPELVDWAMRAGQGLGDVRPLPIRGGTGVDPFLEVGIPVANLGTGYFAPESEKELTSVEMMGRHALWMERLLGEIARG